MSVRIRVAWFLPFEDGQVPMNDEYLMTFSEKALVVRVGHEVYDIDPCLF